MDKNKLLELALTEWTAKFNKSDKKTKDARMNFENLFQKWKDLGGSFDELFETLLPKAIKVHQPLPSVIRNSYKVLNIQRYKSEKEYIEEWNSSIEATAQEAFFEFFPVTGFDHDPEPKVYGGMSASEHRAQQRYLEQFKTLKLDEAVANWENKKNSLKVETIEESVLEDKNETNS